MKKPHDLSALELAILMLAMLIVFAAAYAVGDHVVLEQMREAVLPVPPLVFLNG